MNTIRGSLKSEITGYNLRSRWLIRHVADRTFLFLMWCRADDPEADTYDAVMDAEALSVTLVGSAKPEGGH